MTDLYLKLFCAPLRVDELLFAAHTGVLRGVAGARFAVVRIVSSGGATLTSSDGEGIPLVLEGIPRLPHTVKPSPSNPTAVSTTYVAAVDTPAGWNTVEGADADVKRGPCALLVGFPSSSVPYTPPSFTIQPFLADYSRVYANTSQSMILGAAAADQSAVSMVSGVLAQSGSRTSTFDATASSSISTVTHPDSTADPITHDDSDTVGAATVPAASMTPVKTAAALSDRTVAADGAGAVAADATGLQTPAAKTAPADVSAVQSLTPDMSATISAPVPGGFRIVCVPCFATDKTAAEVVARAAFHMGLHPGSYNPLGDASWLVRADVSRQAKPATTDARIAVLAVHAALGAGYTMTSGTIGHGGAVVASPYGSYHSPASAKTTGNTSHGSPGAAATPAIGGSPGSTGYGAVDSPGSASTGSTGSTGSSGNSSGGSQLSAIELLHQSMMSAASSMGSGMIPAYMLGDQSMAAGLSHPMMMPMPATGGVGGAGGAGGGAATPGFPAWPQQQAMANHHAAMHHLTALYSQARLMNHAVMTAAAAMNTPAPATAVAGPSAPAPGVPAHAFQPQPATGTPQYGGHYVPVTAMPGGYYLPAMHPPAAAAGPAPTAEFDGPPAAAAALAPETDDARVARLVHQLREGVDALASYVGNTQKLHLGPVDAALSSTCLLPSIDWTAQPLVELCGVIGEIVKHSYQDDRMKGSGTGRKSVGDRVRLLYLNSGAVPSLLRLIRLSNPATRTGRQCLEDAIQALCNISFLTDAQRAMLQQPSLGVMRVLADRMRIDGDNVEIQIKVARTVACLCFQSTTAQRQAVACGMVHIAVTALLQHSLDRFAVLKLLELLCCLVDDATAVDQLRGTRITDALAAVERSAWARNMTAREKVKLRDMCGRISTAHGGSSGGSGSPAAGGAGGGGGGASASHSPRRF